MAVTYPVLLVGGPCAGRTVNLSADQLASGMTVCGARVYRYAPDTSNPWIFQLASDQEAGKPVGTQTDPRALFAAFHALMRTLAVTLPRQDRRTRTAIARIRKAVR